MVGGAGGGSAASRAISKPRAAKAPAARKHVRLSSPSPVRSVRRRVSPTQHVGQAARSYVMRSRAGIDPDIPVLPEASVRTAIHVLWHANFRPASPDWVCPNGDLLVPKIQKSLNLPYPDMIYSVLEDSEAAYLDDGGGYNACRNEAGRPALKIDLKSGEMIMISKSLRDGLGRGLITELVNIKRKAKGAPLVSCYTVVRAGKAAGGHVSRRQTQGSGSSDEDGAWCTARLAQAEMVLRMLGTAGFGTLRGPEFALTPDGILHYDQKHKKIELGGGAGQKWQWLFERDDDDRPVKQEDAEEGEECTTDGARKKTTTKYCMEARFCFAVAAPTIGGKRTARRCTAPFDYTGQWLVGPKKFEEEIMKEVARVDNNSKMPNRKKKDKGLDTGYKKFFPETWRDEAMKAVIKHHRCCTDMVDWLVEEGREIFKGSTAEKTWALNGDGLSSWWDAGTQEYFKANYPEEFKRQVRALGNVNSGSQYYKARLVGNSPEFMPLDSNLFSDLERIIITHRALTYDYANDDPKKFCLGTKPQCASAMRRAFAMIPDHRIIRDCDRWAEAYQVVYDNKGKVVRGWGRRSGRRADKQRADPEHVTEFHPDADAGVKKLLDF